VDAPLHIRNIKRYITDNTAKPKLTPPALKHHEKIAVVGAGPSGLSAARDLALMGYPVTVLEAMDKPGGMLRYGIPSYRLPRPLLEVEIAAILELGVELKLGTRVGPMSWERLRQDYAAVYVALGAWKSQKLDLPGEGLGGVVGAIEFLRHVNGPNPPRAGRSVAVIGGGNSAIDAARSCVRLGARKVALVYRRLRQDMPAQAEEIRAAEQEGVEMIFLAAPLRLEGKDGRVSRLICQRMNLGEFDLSGRRRPLPIAGAEFALEVDQVIAAVGQKAEVPFAGRDEGGEFSLNPAGLINIVAGSQTRAGTAMVFAGGDVVSGPATVIKAIAAGRQAAREIDAALRAAKGQAPSRLETGPEIDIPAQVEEPVPGVRPEMPELSCAARLEGFMEVETGLEDGVALAEAGRCLRCDLKEVLE
jgi:NADH-quinone oxidoreductase subunit F